MNCFVVCWYFVEYVFGYVIFFCCVCCCCIGVVVYVGEGDVFVVLNFFFCV